MTDTGTPVPSVNNRPMGEPLPPEGGHSDGTHDAKAEYEAPGAAKIEADTAAATARLAKARQTEGQSAF